MKKIGPLILSILSVAALVQWMGWAQAGIAPFCADCAVAEREKALQAKAAVLSPSHADTLTQGWNIAQIVNHPKASAQPSALQFQAQQAPELPNGRKWWDGQGELPGGFNPSWSLPASNYDPSFVTSYYNPQQGALNVASAPWNFAVPAGWAGGNWPTLATPPSLGSQFQAPVSPTPFGLQVLPGGPMAPMEMNGML